MDWTIAIIAFVLSLVLVPVAGRMAIRIGLIHIPRSDRWSKRPTPHFGGVAIYIAVLVAFLWSTDKDGLSLSILIGISLAFYWAWLMTSAPSRHKSNCLAS